MAYLKAKRKEGKVYYQLIEAYREGGRKHERVLLHLGVDLISPHTLLKWWDYLGRPRIPYRPGIPMPFSKEAPSLVYPCATIVDLNKFLEQASEEELMLTVEGLKFVS